MLQRKTDIQENLPRPKETVALYSDIFKLLLNMIVQITEAVQMSGCYRLLKFF